MYSIWHEMFKIASDSVFDPDPAGQLSTFPRLPSREWLLAFGACNLPDSHVLVGTIASRFQFLPSRPPLLKFLDPHLMSVYQECRTFDSRDTISQDKSSNIHSSTPTNFE